MSWSVAVMPCLRRTGRRAVAASAPVAAASAGGGQRGGQIVGQRHRVGSLIGRTLSITSGGGAHGGKAPSSTLWSPLVAGTAAPRARSNHSTTAMRCRAGGGGGGHLRVARRSLHCTAVARHGHDDVDHDAPEVSVTWVHKDGSEQVTSAKVGMNLMRVAHKHGIELEGACEGVCACSTCHVILEDSVFDSLEEPSEDEEDMLDQAFGLKATSRLGCQVLVTEAMNGIKVTLPSATRNFYVDGHVPVPH